MTEKLQPLGPLQEKWLTILESGILTQAQGHLCVLTEKSNGRVDLSFCCLGIAEHFVMKRHYEETASAGIISYQDDSEVETEVLTKSTAKAMRFHNSSAESADAKHTLAGLNDSGKTFKELAAMVRENPANYFLGPA